jgi:hypothetical protein
VVVGSGKYQTKAWFKLQTGNRCSIEVDESSASRCSNQVHDPLRLEEGRTFVIVGLDVSAPVTSLTMVWCTLCSVCS